MLNSLYKNDFMPISITSISINNQELNVIEPNRSVSWFRSFMHYCIDNRREQILNERALTVRKELESLSKQDVILADRQSIVNLFDAFSKLGDITEKRKNIRPYKLKEIRR
jgi:hypothetical protein